MGVVSDLLILKHGLGTIPCVAREAAVYCCPRWVVMPFDCVDHHTIKELIECSNRLLIF